MESPILTEGASFGEVAAAEATPDASQATPQEQQTEATPAATDGGTTEPEVPAAFKEQPSEEAKPDLSLDKDLEGHPVLKAKWEAFKADKEKGIDKFIQEHNAKLKDLEAFQKDYEPLVEFYQEFDNKDTVDAAFAKLCAGLERTYGRKFGGEFTGQQPPAAPNASDDEDALWEKETWSQSRARLLSDVDSRIESVVSRVVSELKGELEPVKKHFATQSEREAMTAKATAAVTELKQQFEVSADPSLVTPERVQEAMTAFPGLEPRDAFQAKFAVEIAKYFAKHSKAGQQVKNLPTGTSGARTRADLRPGADFAAILEAEATLG